MSHKKVFEKEVVNFTIRKMFSLQWSAVCLFYKKKYYNFNIYDSSFHSWSIKDSIKKEFKCAFCNPIFRKKLKHQKQFFSQFWITKQTLKSNLICLLNCFSFKCWIIKQSLNLFWLHEPKNIESFFRSKIWLIGIEYELIR